MGIETKSIAMLIDEAITNSIRCWFAQEKNFEVNQRIESGELAADDLEAFRLKADAADLAQKTNARRNELMRAIDGYFADPNTQLAKSYSGNSQEIRFNNFAGNVKSTIELVPIDDLQSQDIDRTIETRGMDYAQKNGWKLGLTTTYKWTWYFDNDPNQSPGFDKLIDAFQWMCDAEGGY